MAGFIAGWKIARPRDLFRLWEVMARTTDLPLENRPKSLALNHLGLYYLRKTSLPGPEYHSTACFKNQHMLRLHPYQVGSVHSPPKYNGAMVPTETHHQVPISIANPYLGSLGRSALLPAGKLFAAEDCVVRFRVNSMDSGCFFLAASPMLSCSPMGL